MNTIIGHLLRWWHLNNEHLLNCSIGPIQSDMDSFCLECLLSFFGELFSEVKFFDIDCLNSIWTVFLHADYMDRYSGSHDMVPWFYGQLGCFLLDVTLRF